MSDEKPTEDNLADEFRSLGENLAKTLRSAWESPERKKLQQEMEEGLNQLAATLKLELDTFKESPAGQRLRADVEDMRERVRSGETEGKMRDEVLKALRVINSELEKAAEHWNPGEPASQDNAEDRASGS